MTNAILPKVVKVGAVNYEINIVPNDGWLTKGVLGNAGTFDDTAGFYEDALREIDMHIRSTPEPIPYIIETLKRTLPEYNDCGGDRE